jgi:hypothetical protein
MINHKYKCIFLHIPRTGGTSIEALIAPEEIKHSIVVDVNEKHYHCRQAKEKYAEWWDYYFKFSFVRNPFDRVVSGLIYSDYFGIRFDGQLHFEEYKEKFGYPFVLEHDYRTGENIYRNNLEEGSVYHNFIGDEMNFIGRYENLEQDVNKIKEILGISGGLGHYVPSQRSKYQDYFDETSKKEVINLYYHDFLRYGYKK